MLPLLPLNALPRSPRPSLILAVFPSARPAFTCCPMLTSVDPYERHAHAPKRRICHVIGGALARSPYVGEHTARRNTIQSKTTKLRARGARKKTRKQKKRNRKSARKSVLFSHSGSASISAMIVLPLDDSPLQPRGEDLHDVVVTLAEWRKVHRLVGDE